MFYLIRVFLTERRYTEDIHTGVCIDFFEVLCGGLPLPKRGIIRQTRVKNAGIPLCGILQGGCFWSLVTYRSPIDKPGEFAPRCQAKNRYASSTFLKLSPGTYYIKFSEIRPRSELILSALCNLSSRGGAQQRLFTYSSASSAITLDFAGGGGGSRSAAFASCLPVPTVLVCSGAAERWAVIRQIYPTTYPLQQYRTPNEKTSDEKGRPRDSQKNKKFGRRYLKLLLLSVVSVQ